MCAIKINEIEAKISDSQARNLVRWALRECEIQKGLQHPRGMAASHESRVDWEKAHSTCGEVVLIAKCLRPFDYTLYIVIGYKQLMFIMVNYTSTLHGAPELDGWYVCFWCLSREGRLISESKPDPFETSCSTHTIHGTGIGNTYMNGWSLWFSCRYI